MDSNHRAYNHLASFSRVDETLAKPQTNFEEVNSLPDRDRLTFENGFYANCSAMFVDLRDSSTLPNHYNRPALAKLYRAYISELVAIVNGTDRTREVNIVGDCVWAVFNTPVKSDLEAVFRLAAQANSFMEVLNYKIAKANYKQPVKAGIGLAWGRALMIKAGAKGSTINDVVYMGDVVNRAAKLAGMASKGTPPIYLDKGFHHNLTDTYKALAHQPPGVADYFTSSAYNVAMNDWYTANCT